MVIVLFVFLVNVFVVIVKMVVVVIIFFVLMVVEVVYLWVDVGNEVFLLIVDCCGVKIKDVWYLFGYGCNVFVWLFIVVFGIFIVGLIVLIMYGI